jgi:hypothetical protein
MSSLDNYLAITVTPAGLGSRLRITLGPTLVGLVGGALSGLVIVPHMATLCRNAAATYARYPSIERPALATELPLPAWLSAAALLIGLAAPLGLGVATVWLVRPRAFGRIFPRA